MTTKKLTKLLALYLPYILLGLVATNCGEAWRLAEGKELGDKILSMMGTVPLAFANPLPSLHLVESLKVYLTELIRKPSTADISETMRNLKRLSEWIRDRNLNESDGVCKYTYNVSEKKLADLIEVMMTTYEMNSTEKGK